ncbi:MAG: c-type cytochrome [Betaproteobacteria bacterium]|nr:c-type cytochrome [Betaproteobacteria bacterium]
MMKLSQLKLGEKILFGVTGLIIVFAVLSFIMLEVYRSHLDRPMYPATTQFDFSPEGQKGSRLFRTHGCTDCHRALRNGTNQGVSLDGIGSKRSLDYLLQFLKKPETIYETKTMDHGPTKGAAYVAKLPGEELHAIAVFLSELKAIQGSADARLPMPERSGFVDEMVKIWAPDTWKKERRDLREEAASPK